MDASVIMLSYSTREPAITFNIISPSLAKYLDVGTISERESDLPGPKSVTS
jgi:hypothetical protein